LPQNLNIDVVIFWVLVLGDPKYKYPEPGAKDFNQPLGYE